MLCQRHSWFSENERWYKYRIQRTSHVFSWTYPRRYFGNTCLCYRYGQFDFSRSLRFDGRCFGRVSRRARQTFAQSPAALCAQGKSQDRQRTVGAILRALKNLIDFCSASIAKTTAWVRRNPRCLLWYIAGICLTVFKTCYLSSPSELFVIFQILNFARLFHFPLPRINLNLLFVYRLVVFFYRSSWNYVIARKNLYQNFNKFCRNLWFTKNWK